MAKKQSYGDVEKQIAALLKKQKEMSERAVRILTEAIMKDNVARVKLVDLSGAEIRAVAKKIIANLDGMIVDVRSGGPADANTTTE